MKNLIWWGNYYTSNIYWRKKFRKEKKALWLLHLGSWVSKNSVEFNWKGWKMHFKFQRMGSNKLEQEILWINLRWEPCNGKEPIELSTFFQDINVKFHFNFRRWKCITAVSSEELWSLGGSMSATAQVPLKAFPSFLSLYKCNRRTSRDLMQFQRDRFLRHNLILIIGHAFCAILFDINI